MRFILIKILNILSKRIISKYNPVIIGITGSFGKSSAKKAIYEVLKTKYSVSCNKSIYRNDLGIPLAIIGSSSGGHSLLGWMHVFARAIRIIFGSEKYVDILILEMDVNRPGDMKKMLNIVKPNIGIFTGVGAFPSHLKYFKNEKHIAKEKSLLIKSLGKKDLAILNFDDKCIREMIDSVRSKIVTYGFDKKCTLMAEEIFLSDRKWKVEDGSIGMSFKISYNGTTVPFRLPYALGRVQINATLVAAAVGIHFNCNLLEMSKIFSKYQPLAGRMKLIKGMNGSMIIDDTFNANPSSMIIALETLGKLDLVRKVAILGDMLELGEYCEKGHKEVGEKVFQSADLLFTLGVRSKIISDEAEKRGMKKENVFHFGERNELIERLKNTIKSSDVILVKGSRETHMEHIVKEIMAEPRLADELLVK